MNSNHDGNGQTTENRILAAAEKEFILKGYAGARTTAIAEDAGVTHAMLHYYFRTKENLFDRIIENKVGAVRNIMLGSLGDPSMPLFDKVRIGIERHMEFLAANPDLPKFMVCEVFGNPEWLPRMIDIIVSAAPRTFQELQKQIDECADKGLCRKVDARMLVLDILSVDMFSFIARPIVNIVFDGMMDDMADFVGMRTRENIDTIMRKLRP